MIKLRQIILEQSINPKALILAGSPGAGKSSFIEGVKDALILNVDEYFMRNLKSADISLDLKNATPEERSQQAKSMAAANKEFKGNMADVIAGKESFILDGTAASLGNTLKLKDELEEAGYEVFMLYVYTDLERSLKQNQDRFEKSGGEDRSLAPAIVLSTWNKVTQNYNPYKKAFGDNFVSVANTLEDEKLSDLNAIKDKYLTPFRHKNTKTDRKKIA